MLSVTYQHVLNLFNVEHFMHSISPCQNPVSFEGGFEISSRCGSLIYRRGSNTDRVQPLRPGAEHPPPSRLRYHHSSINDGINFGLDKYMKPTPSPTNTHSAPLLLFLLSVSVSVKCSPWPQLIVFQFSSCLHWGNTLTVNTPTKHCFYYVVSQNQSGVAVWGGGAYTDKCVSFKVLLISAANYTHLLNVCVSDSVCMFFSKVGGNFYGGTLKLVIVGYQYTCIWKCTFKYTTTTL